MVKTARLSQPLFDWRKRVHLFQMENEGKPGLAGTVAIDPFAFAQGQTVFPNRSCHYPIWPVSADVFGSISLQKILPKKQTEQSDY